MGDYVRVSVFIWRVRLTFVRLVFIGVAGYLLRSASEAGQDRAVVAFVTTITVGLIIGGILTCYEQGIIGVLAETFVDVICLGAGILAARMVREHGKVCTEGDLSVWTFAAFAFPLGFLLARTLFGRGLDEKVAKIRRDLGSHATLGRFLGPVVGPPEARGSGPTRHLSSVERMVGVALGFPPYIVTVYLLFSVLGGAWLVDTSTILAPVAHLMSSSGSSSQFVKGLAEAFDATVHGTCLRGLVY